MIVSVHLADVELPQLPGILRGRPDPGTIAGLKYAEPVLSLPLRDRRFARPARPRAGLIAAWDDDSALDDFLTGHPLAKRFEAGWHVRLEPLRLFGFWPGMPDLPKRVDGADDQEPVAVLTLGRPRLRRIVPFLRASAPAEQEAATHPAALASTALARPPRLVATFSLWRSAAEMREYATAADGPHRAAVSADRAGPFHHDSAFVRFRPYASRGSWGGRDPLAGPQAVASG
jgi:hypothetical protein